MLPNSIAAPLPPVSRTLLIPLYVKAKETVRKTPCIMDLKAVEIVEQLNEDKTTYDGGSIAYHGILARTVVLDKEVREFLQNTPSATIINLGAGLDTRFTRLDNGSVRWVDVDLPEAIAIRKKFFAENERVEMISSSVLDSAWTQEIGAITSNSTLIIAEGLLMYFTEAEVRQLMYLLVNSFKGARFYFDVVHSYFVNKGISSDFHWGVNRITEIEELHPSLQIVQSWSTGDLLKKRQPLLIRMMNSIPDTRNRSRILHIHIKGEQ